MMMNKYILLFAIIIINISTLYGQSEIDYNGQYIRNESRITPVDSVVRDTVAYKVFGMDCPGCHGALEKQINKLTAVDYSVADWLNQEVMIVVKKDSVLKEKELFEKIKKANFTPGEEIIR